MSVELAGGGLRPRSGWHWSTVRLAALACMVCCAVPVLACLAGGAAIAARPPGTITSFQPIMLQFANIRLSIDLTNNPDCPPMIVGCLVMPRPNQLYLTVWSSVDRQIASGIERNSRLLLKLRFR